MGSTRSLPAKRYIVLYVVASDGPYRFLTSIRVQSSSAMIFFGMGSPAILSADTFVQSIPSLSRLLTTAGTVLIIMFLSERIFAGISRAEPRRRIVLPIVSGKNISKTDRSKQ